jgi:hypothetical protein
MRRTLLTVVALAAICSTLGTKNVSAQNVYGAFVGNVTDSTGATIPGATRETQTNASGAYSISNIPSGTYTVVNVVTNRDVRVDARLDLVKGVVGGINSTDRAGRQYDQREWRFGARFGF